MRLGATFACFVTLAAARAAAFGADAPAKVDPWVLDTAARGDTEFLVLLREQADLRGAASLPTKIEKAAFVLDALTSIAARSQANVVALLSARGVESVSYTHLTLPTTERV